MPILPPLPRPQRRRIHKIIHATRDKGHARRLMAILLLHEGCTITDVHHITGAARSTIGRWLRWYRDEGVGALEALPAGRAPVLPVAKIVTLLVLLMQFSPQDFGYVRHLLMRLHEHLKMLDKQVNELEDAIVRWHKDSAASQTLAQLPGIGPITASALVASIGNAKNFKNGRQLAAWLGLVPRQHSSGGKQNLLGISKRGDSYLRTLLIHGARAVLRVAERKESFSGSWLAGVMARRNPNVAAVAQANKTARIIWALLAHDRKYDAHYGMAA